MYCQQQVLQSSDGCAETDGTMSGSIRSGEKPRRHMTSLTEDESEDSPQQPKSRSDSEFLGLSRCAGCYNQKASSMPRPGDDGESSSSAEDSGTEVDCESESESSSISSCSEPVVAETPEKPETQRHSPVCGDAAEPDSRGEDGDRREETGETLERQQDENKTKGTIRRALLVKSFSLPSSPAPNLTPLSLLPRSPRMVSTLHLEVLPEKHDDDTSFTIRHLSEREANKTGGGRGRGGEGGGGGGGGLGSINNLLLPQPPQDQQMGLPWQPTQPILQQHHYQQQQRQQQQITYQYQQQPPQYLPPLSAQGQGFPSPSHTVPMSHVPTPHAPLRAPHAPQTHLHTITPQPCWYCYRTHLPYTYWSHYSGGQLHR